MKTISLNIHRNYVSNWNDFHAIRELVSNCIDADREWKNISAFSDHRMHFSTHTMPDMSELTIIGKGSKSDDSSMIGQFGEGFKLALLVFTRNGYDVSIMHSTGLWKPKFVGDVLVLEQQNDIARSCFTVEVSRNPSDEQSFEEVIDEVLGCDPDQIVWKTAGRTGLYCQGIFVRDMPYGKIFQSVAFSFNTRSRTGLNRDREHFDWDAISHQEWFNYWHVMFSTYLEDILKGIRQGQEILSMQSQFIALKEFLPTLDESTFNHLKRVLSETPIITGGPRTLRTLMSKRIENHYGLNSMVYDFLYDFCQISRTTFDLDVVQQFPTFHSALIHKWCHELFPGVVEVRLVRGLHTPSAYEFPENDLTVLFVDDFSYLGDYPERREREILFDALKYLMSSYHTESEVSMNFMAKLNG